MSRSPLADVLLIASIQRFRNEVHACSLLPPTDVLLIGVYSTETHPLGLIYEYAGNLDLQQYLRSEPNAGRLNLVLVPSDVLHTRHPLLTLLSGNGIGTTCRAYACRWNYSRRPPDGMLLIWPAVSVAPPLRRQLGPIVGLNVFPKTRVR